MKLVIIILFTCLMQVSASSLAQKITLSEKNVSIELLLKKIKQQTGYDVLYGDNTLSNTKNISIKLYDAPIAEALDMILEDQHLSYTIGDKTIVIKQKEPSFLERLADRWAAIDISGTVVDDKGIPLPGATVKAKGAKSVITDIKGRFMLEKVEEGATVTISYTGYVTQELPAKQAMGAIAMKLSDNPLDQVQVIAYGTTTRRLSTGNTFTVTAKDIEKQPVQNVLLALQGRVPGLEIIQASGMNGSGVTVRVQGTNSLTNGSDPLVVIDGVPYASQTLLSTAVGADLLGNSGGSIATDGYGNPLNYINPADIESVDVLKDADATAIYGSRAANGAILITTKKGKIGNTQLDLNIQNGWGSVGRFLKVLNTEQYLEMRREAFKNDNVSLPNIDLTPTNTDYDLNGQWDTNKNTNWQNELIGGKAQYRNIIATVSGGNLNSQFRLSGTYNMATTVFKDDNANQSGNLNFSFKSTSQNNRFSLLFSGSYMADVNRLSGGDLTYYAIKMAPNTPTLYNSDGGLNWAPTNAGASTFQNPLSFFEVKYKAKTNNLVSSLGLNYKLLESLMIKANIGYTNQQINEFRGTPLSFYSPESRLIQDVSSLRVAKYSNSNINSWILEPQISYQRSLEFGKFDALVGGTLQQRNSNGLLLEGRGYNSDASLENIRSATSIEPGSSVAWVYKYVGAFGRLSYNFRDKYLVNLNLRRDGSSRFGPASRFHNFWSIGTAWNFSEETFIKGKLPFLSYGKIRGSYGTTGNDQIGDYAYISKLSPFPVSEPYQGTVGYIIDGLFNEHLEWEETRKLQIGLDLGFFKDRILLIANFVHNQSSNQLLLYNLPLITGAYSMNYNFPATLQNKSLELSLNTVNVRNSTFEWTTGFNFTFPENKLIAFPNLENSTYAETLIIGEPFNVSKRRQFVGVNSVTGIFQFAGKNGPTSVSSEMIQDASIIDPQPTYYGGIQNSLNYKGIQLDFNLQFVKTKGFNYNSSGVPGRFNFGNGNQPVAILNRWRKPGDETLNQRFTQRTTLNSIYGQAVLGSDFLFKDASYIRLKNVSLSYRLPTQWTQKISLQSGRIYMHAQNLLTFTNYQGLDPETRSSSSLPPLRLITIGIQATL